MSEGLWGEGKRGVMPARQVADKVALDSSLDQRALAGEKVKVEGENPYLQMQLREKFLQEQLEKSVDSEDAEKAMLLMTPGERLALTAMTKSDLRTLAEELVSRLGPIAYEGGIEEENDNEDQDAFAAK